MVWLGLSLLFLLMGEGGGAMRLWGRRGLWLMDGLVALWLLLVAYIGFAAGVATSIRAAILAYVLAICLGLLWVGLMQLRLHRRTPWIFGGMIATLGLIALWQFGQPKADYVLIGSPEAKIGIVKGTPAALIAAIQYGGFPGAPGEDVAIRTFATPETALAGLKDKSGTSAVLIPRASAPQGSAAIWQAEALGDGNRTAGLSALVLAIILGLLLVGGMAHHRHPLSVGAEFIIDTIRGIPMLVIVLYIGLPLAGAVKDASGGLIDPPNLLRGILAMALAYSAYLAEIFRSGINAVPTGQIEAARSLGLTRWATARHVILPQAFRIIIPPLGNEFIAILKDTSLLSILSIRDITQRMREFQSASFLPFA
ncbi:MAG: amino acid ABC transporter permease, partial [Rhodobacteraceae bacterium]|nr:amino acid ABC transporter permease [Paracoccaceae bacterium]